MNDLLIKNAMVVDGTSGTPYVSSLAVCEGRIAGIGKDLGGAREVVDANGLALMPGIIDGHTHYDAQLTWDSYADPSPALGVTTVVIGNCGFGIAPCRPTDRDLLIRHLMHVEGMSVVALRAGIQWDFETFPEYLDVLERRGLGPNVAAFLGHSALRGYVLGEDASQRTASDDEIIEMQDLVRQAMQAGAVGFSTSSAVNHVGDGGVRMPSLLADEREMRALVNAMGERGRGIFMIHKDKKDTPFSYLESLAADSGRPALISSLRYSKKQPEHVFGQLAEISAAQARGHRLYGQAGCIPRVLEFTLRNCHLFYGSVVWQPAVAAIQQQDEAALKAIYADSDFRRRLKDDIVAQMGKAYFDGDWSRIHVAAVARPEHRAVEGKSVAESAAAEGRDPLDWFFDFGLTEDLETLYTITSPDDDPESISRLIADPNVHLSLSDGGAHLSFLCDAGYGLYLLSHFVREYGLMSIEQAAHKLSAHPAKLFGIRDRGLLKPGYAADLMLVDPLTVGMGPKRRVFDLPGGDSRLTLSAEGLHGVWVNGVQIADARGLIREARRPGMVLRDFSS
jgi:N-acyl-D-aspartate/D-glutamate deacylase